jgi:hypothetical protein
MFHICKVIFYLTMTAPIKNYNADRKRMDFLDSRGGLRTQTNAAAKGIPAVRPLKDRSGGIERLLATRSSHMLAVKAENRNFRTRAVFVR